MQVTELAAEGLKREYKVVVDAGEIETRVGKRLTELQKTIRMPGFRPGKVPVKLLRKQYGRSVMGEILEQAVNQGSQLIEFVSTCLVLLYFSVLQKLLQTHARLLRGRVFHLVQLFWQSAVRS